MTAVPGTVAQALAQARALGVERMDAQLILARQLAQPRSWLVAHPDAPLPAPEAAAVHAALARCASGEPLAYVLGEQEFHQLRLEVDPNVLIPRSDTEVLVNWAVEWLSGRPAARVVDLGTGSGAIALAVKHACPGARVLATDVSQSALEVARRNARRLALNVEFAPGSWWAATGDTEFDLILSNPPYIAAADPHLAALTHEPQGALTPGGDGLGALREIVRGAAKRLRQDGQIMLEHGHDQAEAVQALLREAGWIDVITRMDLGGRARCTGARH